MNLLLRFSSQLVLLLLTVHVTLNEAEEERRSEDAKIDCSVPNTRDECPVNAICSALNGTTKNFQCTCLPNYLWNPVWRRVISDSNANANANATNNNTDADSNNNNNNPISNQFKKLNSVYCLNGEAPATAAAANATPSSNGKIYVRQPAKVEHLAFGILMVLFAAIGAISVLYLLTILRPIKRTRAAYTLLRRRRENRQRLEEFCDDISMIELREKR